MSKGLCCTETKLIGCFNSCDDIDTGLVATETGIHTIKGFFNNAFVDQDVNITIGNNIIIPNIYNEYTQQTIKIINPSGSTFVDGTADCFIMSFGVKV
jgi:hypothetical protein